MDIVRGAITLFFLLSSSHVFAVNAWVPKWVDGPATATYERTPTALRTYVNVPSSGGHVQYTLNSNPAKSWAAGTPSGTSGNFGPASTSTTPKIATNVKIPILPGAAVGSAVAATLTMSIPKASLAKAGVALMRASPYVSAAITFGWLANAGYHYFSDTDTFTQSQLTGQTCLSPSGSTPCQPTPQEFCDQWTWALPVNPVINGNTGFCVSTAFGQLSAFIITHPQTVSVPVTPADVENGMQSSPVSGTTDTADNFDGVLGEVVHNGFYPDPETGSLPNLSGSTTPIQGPKSTTVTPTGDVITNNTIYTNTFTNNYVDSVATTTTTTTPSSGTPQTTVTTGPVESQVPIEQKTDCDKYPDSIGCSKFGDITAPEAIPVTVLPATLSYTSWGSGSCPVSQTVHGITFDYTPYCEKFIMLKPAIFVLGLIASLFIVIGPVRET